MRIACHTLTAAFLMLGAVYALAGDDFPPVKPFELAMQKDASNPSTAEILYHESRTNNREHYKTEYYRIKVFTEEARRYADVTIPYSREVFTVSDVKARTVHTDGTIISFDGKIFDKTIAKRGGIDLRAKAFSLPDVQPGCILEYRYRVSWDRRYWVAPKWILQDELPTLQATFGMIGPPGVRLAYTAVLPAGAEGPQFNRDGIELTLANIPPFEHEDFSLPDDALKMRVLFYEAPADVTNEAAFWKEQGKALYKIGEAFTGAQKGVAEEVGRLVQASDPPEAKLRKLYARAQQIRNLTYERIRTEAEEKREKLKEADSAGKVLEHGYGYRNQINATFVALARAAGFETAMVYVTERDDDRFEPQLLDLDQVRWRLAVVELGNEERFFDPGTPGCPFGLLPWEDIRVQGVRPTPDGVQFVTTPVPNSDASQRLRNGEFSLAEDGSLHGRLSVIYTGLDALGERLRALHKDEAERHKQVEESIRDWLPSATQVKVEKVNGWDDAEQPLQVEATLDIPSRASTAGSRLILPSDVFQTNRTNPFDHASRKWDVFFDYPYATVDDWTLHLPAGWQVEGLPPSHEVGGGVRLRYQVSRTQAGADVHIQRRFRLTDVFFESDFYPALRQFYTNVGASDEEPMVLRVGAPAK